MRVRELAVDPRDAAPGIPVIQDNRLIKVAVATSVNSESDGKQIVSPGNSHPLYTAEKTHVVFIEHIIDVFRPVREKIRCLKFIVHDCRASAVLHPGVKPRKIFSLYRSKFIGRQFVELVSPKPFQVRG